MSTTVYNMLGFAVSLVIFVVLSLNAAKIKVLVESVRDLVAIALNIVAIVAIVKFIMMVIKMTF